MTEHPADLFEAAKAERHAKIAAVAFQMPPLRPRGANILQGILRRAWEVDAKAADARLGRAALVGAVDLKTGSRGRAEVERKKVQKSEISFRSQQVINLLRSAPRTRAQMADALGITPCAADNLVDRMRKKGAIKRVGLDGRSVVYGVSA